jgi:hypothetical protein
MMDMPSTDTSTKPRYTLSYGLRLDKGTASELTHPRVPIQLPDGSVGIDAFFDIYADVYADV